MMPESEQEGVSAAISAFLSFARDGVRRGRSEHGLNYALGSDTGLRRSENQDRVVCARIETKSRPLFVSMVVDGIGGGEHGATAAALTATEVLLGCIEQSESSLGVLVRKAIERANREVYKRFGGADGAAVALFAKRGGATLATHLGDSRIYSIFGLPQKRLKRLSVDHTLAAQIKRHDPDADVSAHSDKLLQFVGMGGQPEIPSVEIPSGSDAILLTSDGVHKGIPPAVLQFCVQNSSGLKILVERLLELSRWAGGDDNASATVIKLDEPETYRKTAALIVDCNTEVLHIPTLQEHLSDGARTRKYSVKDQTSKNRPRIKDNRKRQLEREEVIFVEDDAAASDVSARAKLGLVQRPEQLELEPES